MLPLEEVKERKRLKILTSNKLLTSLPILFVEIKAGNNSKNEKMRTPKYYIFCISRIKSLKKYVTIWLSHFNNGRKYDCNKNIPNKTSQNSLF